MRAQAEAAKISFPGRGWREGWSEKTVGLRGTSSLIQRKITTTAAGLERGGRRALRWDSAAGGWGVAMMTGGQEDEEGGVEGL